MNTPWDTGDDALARAFRAGFARLAAVLGNVEQGQIDSQGCALLFGGLDPDPELIQLYTGTLAYVYQQRMDEGGRRIVAEADQAGETREDYAPRLRAYAAHCLAAIAQTALLIGELYGVELERTTGVGKPLPKVDIGHVLAEEHDTASCPHCQRRQIQAGRVPTIAERVELSRDAVQAVLDLEADHLDRVAPTLRQLGIEGAANLVTAAAAVIRYELGGGDVDYPVEVARQHNRQQVELGNDQADQLARVLKMTPERRARYLAELAAMETRHRAERDQLDSENGQSS